MRRLFHSITLLFGITLAGCTAGFILQADSNPLISSVTELPPTAFPTAVAINLPLNLIAPEHPSQQDSADFSSGTSPYKTQLSAPEDRPAVESVSILEKTSRFGIPYDEKYTFQIDTAIWEPLIIFDEGEWFVRQIKAILPPSCTIEIKTSREESADAETVKQKQNRYRSMGSFATAGLVFDLSYYTSNADDLADTQHVFYILTSAGSDEPYLVKPLFHASSAFKDWEDCRSLVRTVLSTLEMKRVPVAP
jgi:hypothetical protein